MPDRVLTLSAEEDDALAIELARLGDSRTPEQWLKDQTAWALAPLVDALRVERARLVLASLDSADPAQALGDFKAQMTKTLAVAPVLATPALPATP